MASASSLIIRNAEARDRIDAAITGIEKAGIQFEKTPVTHRDKDVAQTQQLENFANAFEAINEHLAKEKEEPTPPKKTTPKSK